MKQLMVLVGISCLLFSCSDELLDQNNQTDALQVSNSECMLFKDSLALFSYDFGLDPTIDHAEYYDGPYQLEIKVGTCSRSSYDHSSSLAITGTAIIQYIVHKNTHFKRVLNVSSFQTKMTYSSNHYYLLWTDTGSRAWSTTAFSDYDMLTPYAYYVFQGRITGSEGFFSPYEEADEIVNYYGSININYNMY